MVKLKALAVLRLMARSNFVGALHRQIGRSLALVLNGREEYGKASRAVGLLCAHRDRRCRSTESRDELPPSHLRPPNLGDRP
jgi:hypothetical protein